MKIEWTQKATKGLDEIVDPILEENPQAAVGVLDRIEQMVEHLLEHPGMGRPGRVKNTRELIIPELPWILPYLTAADTITIPGGIHAVMHWPGTTRMKVFNQEPEQCWVCQCRVKACPQQAIEVRSFQEWVPMGGAAIPGFFYRVDFPDLDDENWKVFVNSRMDPETGEWEK